MNDATNDMDSIAFTVRGVQATVLVLTCAAIGLGFVIALWLGRSVMKTLGGEPHEAMQAVRRISSGDLTQAINAKYPGSLMTQMEAMRSQLRGMISKLSQEAGRLSSHAVDLASSSNQVAKAAGDGSTSASEMAATVEEMTVSISQVSDNASAAKTSVQRSQQSCRS
ncbi:MAG: methyl-accepting chemotaxis protein [Rhodocyclaceae bacterium]